MWGGGGEQVLLPKARARGKVGDRQLLLWATWCLEPSDLLAVQPLPKRNQTWMASLCSEITQ